MMRAILCQLMGHEDVPGIAYAYCRDCGQVSPPWVQETLRDQMPMAEVLAKAGAAIAAMGITMELFAEGLREAVQAWTDGVIR